VAEILSVMRNAAQPFGTVDPARPNISSTIWRTVIDFTNGAYFFESSFSPNIVWVRVRELDLSPGQPPRVLRLSGDGSDLVGDVTGRFETAEAFAFLPAG
jgi:choloylglycine hydrolase